jgi:hypothetical protein
MSLSSVIENSQIMSAFNSIDKNSSGYNTLTFYTAFIFLFTLAFILLTMIYIQEYDFNVTRNSLNIFSVFVFVFLAILFLTYVKYLQSIGGYIYSRIKPTALLENKCANFKRELGILPPA